MPWKQFIGIASAFFVRPLFAQARCFKKATTHQQESHNSDSASWCLLCWLLVLFFLPSFLPSFLDPCSLLVLVPRCLLKVPRCSVRWQERSYYSLCFSSVFSASCFFATTFCFDFCAAQVEQCLLASCELRGGWSRTCQGDCSHRRMRVNGRPVSLLVRWLLRCWVRVESCSMLHPLLRHN